MRDPSLTLLWWIWAAHWRAHPGRSLVAVAAIAVGVALGLGVDLVNRSALGEFDSALAIINGEAHAQVRGASSGFDEAVFPALAADPRIAALQVHQPGLAQRKALGRQHLGDQRGLGGGAAAIRGFLGRRARRTR